MATTLSCSTTPGVHTFEQANKDTTSVLCIGMEKSKYGECTGSQLDALRMFGLLSRSYSKHATILISEQATRATVIQKMIETCQNDLAIIFYSGHGGEKRQTETTKENFPEPSGKDQHLCLYDNYLLDDEIWEIICQAKGRVVLIFDCCHSATMYRSPMAFGAKPSNGTFGARAVPNMLCISGCPDDSFSYGDKNGGLLTNAILKCLKEDRTYEKVWKILHADSELNTQEKVQFAEFGESFKDFLIFR